MAALRLVALSSDAYGRLDWSAGLLTDEGFYSHNARNVALFGHARTDDFNNMLVSPVLHYVQVGVFAVFGPGVVPLRMISVVCSFLTLLLLWAALKPVFGRGVALAAVCFLGFDHMALLYHRLGLMDTPASLPAAAALWAFSHAIRADEPTRRRWLCAVGAFIGLAIVVRSLCAYLLPVPLVALWLLGRGALISGQARQPVARPAWTSILAPLAGVLGLYLALWWLPHRAELAVMNRYYLFHQLLPGSAAHLGWNAYHAVLGDFRGLSPYLFRHSPALFVLALAWFAGLALGVQRPDAHGAERPLAAYLTAWLLCGWALLAVVGYSPSRYYVTTYPALAAVAALGLRNVPAIWSRVWQHDARARTVRAALAWFLSYHAVQSIVHHGGRFPLSATLALLYGLPVAVAASCVLVPAVRAAAGRARVAVLIPAILVVAWAGVDLAWLVNWGSNIRYTQAGMSQWLNENLPPGAVLLGDVAPGVSMDSRFVSVNIIPRLCNDIDPVGRFAGHPRYAVILDGRWKEAYWQKYYPRVVRPQRRVLLCRVLRWDVGVYAVD